MTVVEDGRLVDVVLADVVDVETLQNNAGRTPRLYGLRLATNRRASIATLLLLNKQSLCVWSKSALSWIRQPRPLAL